VNSSPSSSLSLTAPPLREYPAFATDLQSLCWGCMSLFAISGYLTSGFMITTYGSIVMFRLLIISSLVIILTGAMNWFGDVNKQQQAPSHSPTASPLHKSEPLSSTSLSASSSSLTTCLCGLVTVDKSFLENHTALFFIGTFIPLLAILLSCLMLLFSSWSTRLLIVLLIWSLVSSSFYLTARCLSQLPAVANAGLFIFLSNSITPDIETALFYWYTNSPDGPQFSPQFVGYISGIAFGAMFLGILLYNRYLSSWRYRTIFAATMLFLALMGLMDVVLVKRWNLSLGIPDEVLILGDSALSPMARRFYVMPLFILAAKVCPNGAEATVFSLLTALGNFGSSISVYSGSLVLSFFEVSEENYDNLVTVILLKCLCRLLPILLIPLLIPNGSPYDKEEGSEGGEGQSQGAENDSVRARSATRASAGGAGGEDVERGNGGRGKGGGGLFGQLQEKITKKSRRREGYVGIELDSSERSTTSEAASLSSATPLTLSPRKGVSDRGRGAEEDDEYEEIVLPFSRRRNLHDSSSSSERRARHVDQVKILTTPTPPT
jgi:hypothetical protein